MNVLRRTLKRPTGGRTLAVAAAVLGVLVAGCGSGQSQDDEPVRLSASEVCAQGILNADAVRALELLTGASEFDPPKKTDNESMSAVADSMSRGYAAIGASRGDQVCKAVPFDSNNRHDVSVSFEIEHESQRTGEQSESGKGSYWEYDLGRNALAISRQAKLFFDCASTRLAGLDKAVPVAASVSISQGSKGDEPGLREANLTIVHSAALAMAKELGCKDNGGLPDTLVVRQKLAPAP